MSQLFIFFCKKVGQLGQLSRLETKGIVAAASLAIAAPELLDSADEDGFTPLHLSVIQGNLAMVNFLLANNADINAVDNEGHSVVHWATVCGEVEILRTIILAGANITIADINGATPLHYAAQMCGTPYDIKTTLMESSKLALDILHILLIHPQCNVNVQDKDGRQPILWAASAGSSKAVAAIVKARGKVDSADKDGLTALHCAASRGHTECIDTLVSLCGATTDLIDSNGCTALHYAVTLGHADATARLLELDANPNHQDQKGRSPAHCGCAKGQLETVKILKAHGANLWLRNARGDFPIHEATISGRRELIEWLLLQKIQHVNTTSNDGRSMLHIAANHNYTDICKILLDYGANINATYKNIKGTLVTPLDSALHKGYRSTAKFLQSQGGLPATKLYINGQFSNAFKNLTMNLELPIKYEEDMKKIDLSDSKKIIVYFKEICCDNYKYVGNCNYKFCKYRDKGHKNNRCKINKIVCFRGRSNSCNNKRKKTLVSDLYRSKSNLDIRCQLSQNDDENINETESSDSCDNCCYHKRIKHHVLCQKKKKIFINTKIKNYSNTENHNSNNIKLSNGISTDCVTKSNIEQNKDTLFDKNYTNDLPTSEGAFKDNFKNDSIDTNACENKIILQDTCNLPVKNIILENDYAETTFHSNGKKENTNALINEQLLKSDKLQIRSEEELAPANNAIIDNEIQNKNCYINNESNEIFVEDINYLDINDKQLTNVTTNILEPTNINDNMESSKEHHILQSQKLFQNELKKDENNFNIKKSPGDLEENFTTSEASQNNSNSYKKINKEPEYSEKNNFFGDFSNEKNQTLNLCFENPFTSDIKRDFYYSDINKAYTVLPLNSSDNKNYKEIENIERTSSFQILTSDNDLNIGENFLKSEPNLNNLPEFNVLTDVNADIFSNYIKSETGSHCNKPVKNEGKSDFASNHILTELGFSKEQKRKNLISKDRQSNYKISSYEKSSRIPVPKKKIHNLLIDNGRLLKSELTSCLKNYENCHQTSTKPGDRNACNMKTVTESIQGNVKRYYMERNIFQHLLGLKSMQIKSNKYNEPILVKRAVNNFHKSFAYIDSKTAMRLQRYNSTEYTFKKFELFLYETLKKLQKPGANNFRNIENVYTEVKHHLSLDNKTCTSALQCTSKTHRCFHAAHAYTGIPCAAYIPMVNHHTMPKFGFCSYKNSNMRGICLPMVLNTSRESSIKSGLEQSQEQKKQFISLPLDKSNAHK